jgi:flagellar biosynthetic protein FlhB
MADSGERTEKATQKRMKDVRSKGQLSTSKDLTAWIGVGVGAVMIPLTIQAGTAAASTQFQAVRLAMAKADPALALSALGSGLGSILATVGPMLAVIAVAVLAGTLIQGGVHIKRLLSFEHLNIVRGFSRILGKQALWEGAKALLKTAVLGTVLFFAIQGLMPVLMGSGSLPLSSLVDAANQGAATLLRVSVGVGLALAAVDVIVIIRRNLTKTRMTRQELKDENRSTDGDPLVKSQRRSRQLVMSRNRMIAAISGADVVLVNPTHVAVALRYEPGKSAPRVVAKGAGTIATRIREQAEADRVPMVRDIPLARALHASCELGQEIPIELYNAVAQVLAFVLRLKARGAAQGVHTMTTKAAA